MLGRLVTRSPGLLFEKPLVAALLAAVHADEQEDRDLAEAAVPKSVARLHQVRPLSG